MASSSSLLRALPFLRRRLQLHSHSLITVSQSRWPLCTTAGEPSAAVGGFATSSEEISAVKEAPKYSRWKDKEDIEPIFSHILHSSTPNKPSKLERRDKINIKGDNQGTKW